MCSNAVGKIEINGRGRQQAYLLKRREAERVGPTDANIHRLQRLTQIC